MALSPQEFLKLKGTLIKNEAPVALPVSTVSKVKDIGTGFLKGVGASVQGLQDLGQRSLAAIDPTKNTEEVKEKSGIKPLANANFDAKNNYEKGGKVAETIAEFLLPVGGSEKAASLVDDGVNAVTKKIPKIGVSGEGLLDKGVKTVLGEADSQIIKSSQNPAIKAFKDGTKKVQDVVSNIESGIQSFEKGSKEALQKVKDEIPEIDLHPKSIADAVNNGILDTVERSSTYKGIRNSFDTAKDAVESGLFTSESAEKIKSVVNFVKNWKDTTARGALNLKESLQSFVKNGEAYQDSNAVIRSMQRNLKDLVAEAHPPIKKALNTASENISKAEDFTQHLFGKDAVSGESKILQLARNLTDKAKNGLKIELSKELEKVGGKPVMQDLQNLSDYLQSLKLKEPGLQKPIEEAKYFVKKGIERFVKLK